MWASASCTRPGRGARPRPRWPPRSARTPSATSGRCRRKPLDLDAYLASPFVVDPFRADDCTTEVDGACAVLVTSLAGRAICRHPPAVIAAGGYRAGPRPGLDIGDHLLWDDYTRNYTSCLRDELFGRPASRRPTSTFAEIYDCFTSTVLMGLEGLGLCGRGESGAFVRSGATALDGALADQHQRRSARRGLPARHEHRRRGRVCRFRAAAATARCRDRRWAWSPPAH